MTYRRVKDSSEIVVIFKTHLRKGADAKEYERTSRRMREIVGEIPGFISIKGYTAEDGEEIDIVRFTNEKALEAWRTQPEHRATQERDRAEFYDHYWVQACKVFREYEFSIVRSGADARRKKTVSQKAS